MTGPPVDSKDVLRRALIEIRALKERLATAEKRPATAEPTAVATAEQIAVVGIGCRFPGGIDSPGAFWRLLDQGTDTIGARPAGRWHAASETAPREGGFLADVEGFDARFFGIAPREAAAMDPQHRLLLEVVWEALEHAAIDPHRLAGTQTGVFVGLATNDFARRVPDQAVDRYFGVGSSPAVASGRIAYLLDLRGPCLTLDTACSSSLVAVHYAMRALRDRDCDTALAGGVSLMLSPSLGESFVSAGMLAPDGRCKSFDARADGYGRGEGAGMVVLRRLSDALKDGDPVLAVLRGSAINQDGRSAGLTAPNGPAQTALLRAALDASDLEPNDIDYVEAHGTGTPLGDPIEWHALATVFAGRDRPLLVGSVKTNIGHTEAAAGVAGLIKTVLALGRGAVPASLHFTRRNPAIGAGSAGLEVPVATTQGIRRAGVSAFGFSGTNAHVVLEAAPQPAKKASTGDILFLSAHSSGALRELAERYTAAFRSGLNFADACHTAATGRARFSWWVAVRSPAELAIAQPSDSPPPVLPATTGTRVVLPLYPFQREHFALPGSLPLEQTFPFHPVVPVDRVLAPDDPLLAGTNGLAHLGVLLHLVNHPGGAHSSFAGVTFPAPLVVTTRRNIRVEHGDGRIRLQSRAASDTDWTTHFDAGFAAAGSMPPIPAHAPTPCVPADALYTRIAAAGFHYGPAARSLVTIAVDGDIASGTLTDPGLPADLTVDLAPDLTPDLTPGAIEAAAQLAYALLPPDALPVMLSGADRLVRHPGATPTTAWLRRTSAPVGGGFRADFGVSDAAGRVRLHVEGASFVPLPDHSQRWSRLVTWQPATSTTANRTDAFVWHPPQGDAATLCAALLEVLPHTETRPLWIVTCGAQSIGDEAAPPAMAPAALSGMAPAALGGTAPAALWGMAQAIIAERPALRCRLIDLDPDASPEAHAAALAAEADDEPYVAWRGGQRLARRLEAPSRILPATEIATLPSPGVLVWKSQPPAEPAPGMVRIAVVAAGLTFRDRLLFNGLAPAGRSPVGGSPLGGAIGADCAGIVEAAGHGVSDIAVGDRVIALADHAIADSVTVPAHNVAPTPCADLIAAASMPVPYLTALAGLPSLGPKDCVLVHQAASATGLAAATLARRAGARVILTASRQRHRWFAPETVLDSRDPASWGDALAGVTVAFGAFDSIALARLEGIPVVNLDKRAAHHFDLDLIDAPTKRALLGRLGDLPPLPHRPVKRADLATALSGQGPLVGRSVVLLRDPPPARIEAGAHYLVTGASGALGGMVADWLSAAGAVVCRVDPAPQPAGSSSLTVQADAGDEPAMAALLARLRSGPAPLRGIFHCAALVDDDRLEQQSPQRLAAVIRAKVDGAMVLDRLTRQDRLDHFVMFASIVGVIPAARQAGYAAANAVLDQIARARRRRGLPGLSLDWGPWHAGIGRAMGERVAEVWQGFGVTPILPAAGLRALPALLASPEPQRIVADMQWDAEAPSAAPSRPENGPVTIAQLQNILAPLLGIRDPATLDPDTPLLSLGLDSLTALEFARALSRTLHRPVAPDFVYNHPTLTQAAQALTVRRPLRIAGFLLRAPRWESKALSSASPTDIPRWTVAGHSVLAASLPTAPDAPNLVDLSALDVASSGAPDARDALFPGLLARLRAYTGKPARIMLVVRPGALAGVIEAFATALAAEHPRWDLRTVTLDLDDAAPALLGELALDDGEPRVRLSRHGRQVMRLSPVPIRGPWHPSPDATYLVTGGSGGIGAHVAAHLLAKGARHLILAARRPFLPSALTGNDTRITLHPVDLADPSGVAAMMARARDIQPPLRGIFHAAGITADGTIAASDWTRLGRGFPPKADAARLMDQLSRDIDLDVFLLFSSSTTVFGLAGTAGYAAANGFLDGLAQERAATGLPATSVAWGAWQGVGMASDPALWQDGRVPSLNPETALAAMDAALASGESSLVATDPAWRPNHLQAHNVPAAARGRT